MTALTHIDAGGPLPRGVREFDSDYQEPGYGGPNPPAGPAHRYVFTVHALPTETLGVPQGAANVQARFAIHTAALDAASVMGTFQQG